MCHPVDTAKYRSRDWHNYRHSSPWADYESGARLCCWQHYRGGLHPSSRLRWPNRLYDSDSSGSDRWPYSHILPGRPRHSGRKRSGLFRCWQLSAKHHSLQSDTGPMRFDPTHRHNRLPRWRRSQPEHGCRELFNPLQRPRLFKLARLSGSRRLSVPDAGRVCESACHQRRFGFG